MLQADTQPIMCSYKVVKVFFEVWGLQGKVESSVHRVSHEEPCFIYSLRGGQPPLQVCSHHQHLLLIALKNHVHTGEPPDTLGTI